MVQKYNDYHSKIEIFDNGLNVKFDAWRVDRLNRLNHDRNNNFYHGLNHLYVYTEIIVFEVFLKYNYYRN